MEQGPRDADGERVDRVFRAMHSVKGGAGFFGCQVIEELAHAMENVLEELRQAGSLPEQRHGRCDAGRNRPHLGLAGRCRTEQRGGDPGRAPATAALWDDAGQAVVSAAAAAVTPETRPRLRPLPEPTRIRRDPRRRRGTTRPERGPVRVSVPLVDRLMTLAGELVLVRNQTLRSIDAGDAALRPVLQRLDALTSQLQGAVTQTRMQPVGNLFARFPAWSGIWPDSWTSRST